MVARLGAWATCGALAWVLVHRCLLDAGQPVHCDTTYLWQGYEEVLRAQGGAYSLVRFADADRERAPVYARLQQRHVVPVLFVHGHLGSHQQMRSAAAETGRELERRLAADASWPLWLQWYGADFSAEASALDPALLDQQAEFVLACIQHLRQAHANASAISSGAASTEQQPFRLVLVGYSMGGIVARDVVRRLAADTTFDMAQLVALLTLGAPDHFPAFMPSHPLASLQSGPKKPCCLKAAAAAAARAAAVPRANVAAGAADYFLPHTLASGGVPPAPPAKPELSLLMRDVPGVWTTSGHKSIVSCNQLVRQMVPLLADAAAASLQQAPGGLAERQAAIQHLLQQRLATNAGMALGLAASPVQQQEEEQAGCAADALLLQDRPPQVVDGRQLVGAAPAGRPVRLMWDAAELREGGAHGLLLLVTAASPCSHWSVAALPASGGRRWLTGEAAALPPLAPALQPVWAPRPWDELTRGVDWPQNATRVLYVPFAAADGTEPLSFVSTALVGADSGHTQVVAQVLDAPPSQQALRLHAPGGSATALDEEQHAAVVALQLPTHAWPLDSGACEAGDSFSLGCLGRLLLGGTPPWTLRIRTLQCTPTSGGDGPGLSPAVLGVAGGAAPADSVRVVVGAETSVAGAAVPLWDGLALLDRLLLVSDPDCSYSLWLEWDVAGWLGVRLRQLLFVLPALCMAISQARLSPLRGAATRVAVAAALLAAWGSLRPEAVSAASGGLHPWLRLSAVEALAALGLAAGGASLVGALQLGKLRALSWALPASAAQHAALLSKLGAGAVVVAAALAPPAVAAICGGLCLAVRLAVASKSGKAGDGAAQRRAKAWLVYHGQLALLPCAALYSWAVGGRPSAVAWTDGRLLVAALALHACLLRCGGGKAGGAARQQQDGSRRLTLAATHEAAAAAAAAASLWGHPWVCLVAACASAAMDGL